MLCLSTCEFCELVELFCKTLITCNFQRNMFSQNRSTHNSNKKEIHCSSFTFSQNTFWKLFSKLISSNSCSTNYFHNVKSVFGTLLRICDGAFLRKLLPAKTFQLFLPKISIIDVLQCCYAFHHLLKNNSTIVQTIWIEIKGMEQYVKPVRIRRFSGLHFSAFGLNTGR